jgi:hypothetical protein
LALEIIGTLIEKTANETIDPATLQVIAACLNMKG